MKKTQPSWTQINILSALSYISPLRASHCPSIKKPTADLEKTLEKDSHSTYFLRRDSSHLLDTPSSWVRLVGQIRARSWGWKRNNPLLCIAKQCHHLTPLWLVGIPALNLEMWAWEGRFRDDDDACWRCGSEPTRGDEDNGGICARDSIVSVWKRHINYVHSRFHIIFVGFVWLFGHEILPMGEHGWMLVKYMKNIR